MKPLLWTSIALALSASAAAAADLPARNVPLRAVPLPVFTWTGFFVGGHVGGNWGRSQTTETPLCVSVCQSQIDRFSGTDAGFLGGVQAGANYQIGSVVLGLVGDISATGYDNTTTFPCCAPDYVSVKQKWEGSVRARFGFAVDRALLYVTGGVAFGDFEYKYVVFGPDRASTISKNRTGWTLGGGVEFAVDYNWSVFGEYRYTDYGHLTNLPAAVGPFSERHHDTENAVRLGVNYRF